MPEYTIKDPATGRTLRVRGDSAPTQDEAARLFASRRTIVDSAIDALPVVGSMVGGTVGGVGGTAFGMGFGGIPGAAAGAGVGGAAGEAIKQLIKRARGASGDAVPASMLDAAGRIGSEGVVDAAMTAGGGLALKGAGAGLRLVKGLTKAIPSSVPSGMREAVTEGIKDEIANKVPGGSIARRIARSVMRGPSAAAGVADDAAEGVRRAATPRAPMVEGYERYMPNIGARTGAERLSSALAEAEGGASGLTVTNPNTAAQQTAFESALTRSRIGGRYDHLAPSAETVERMMVTNPNNAAQQAAFESALTGAQIGGTQAERNAAALAEALAEAEQPSMFRKGLEELRSGSLNRAMTQYPRMRR